MTARAVNLKQRIRSAGGKLIRRLGLVPAGTPDRNGEDQHLRGTAWDYEVMVYFADTTAALYQIEQWYSSFQALNEVHPVVVVCLDSKTAAAIRRDSGLPVHTIAQSDTIDSILNASPSLKLCLYVTHNVENFANLRFSQLIHASMMHGDSDKLVTVSNQTKAYDFSLVAGQAAVDRMAKHSMLFDANSRCVQIGRPQVERHLNAGSGIQRTDKKTILYAPSWEGDDDSGAYGTVASHGVELVQRLIDSGKFSVIYRPHPLTGVRLPAYREADHSIRKSIETVADPALARVDTSGEISEAFVQADLLISDISGVTIDWLPTTKPLIITVPARPEVRVANSKLTELSPRLSVQDTSQVVTLVTSLLQDKSGRSERESLAEYYLGDFTPGAATKRFISACTRFIDIQRAEQEKIE